MATDITDNDRMNLFLTSITDFKIHDKPFEIKERIKIFGIASEIFEEALVPFIPKILSGFTKIIKEDHDGKYQAAISDTVGLMVQNIIDDIEDADQQKNIFETNFLKFEFNLVEKSQNKNLISTAFQCLTKSVINCPEHVLNDSLKVITDKLITLLKLKSFPCKQ